MYICVLAMAGRGLAAMNYIIKLHKQDVSAHQLHATRNPRLFDGSSIAIFCRYAFGTLLYSSSLVEFP
jgi:hypothetical protein